jgi:hypothetical protein
MSREEVGSYVMSREGGLLGRQTKSFPSGGTLEGLNCGAKQRGGLLEQTDVFTIIGLWLSPNS